MIENVNVGDIVLGKSGTLFDVVRRFDSYENYHTNNKRQCMGLNSILLNKNNFKIVQKVEDRKDMTLAYLKWLNGEVLDCLEYEEMEKYWVHWKQK